MKQKTRVSMVSVVVVVPLMFATPLSAIQEYEDFDASNFDNPTSIDNKWHPLTPGAQFVWEGSQDASDGKKESVRVVYTVTDFTKVIDGVRTVVTLDEDYVDGALAESEIGFFAQDNDGAVWNFGQYPEEYEDEKLVGTPGWLHGRKDGRAGIAMSADPQPGKPSYSQGYAPSIPWTDRGEVEEDGLKVTVRYGSFDNVVMVAESAKEEPGIAQLKYYAAGVGNVKVGVRGDPQNEILELVKVETVGEDELERVRKRTWELDMNSRENAKEYFAQTRTLRGTRYTRDYNLRSVDFTDLGENTYYILKPGYQLLLEGEEDGEWVVFIQTVLNETRKFFIPDVGWVSTRIVEEKEWVDGTPFETALGFFAIDKVRNDVWDFGNEVFNYDKDGQSVLNNWGTWHAGAPDADGLAEPGIMVPGTFLLGARYAQEQAEGKSMERAENEAMGLTVETPAGTFNNVIRVRESNLSEPWAQPGYKFHAPGVGLIKEDTLEITAYGYDIFDRVKGKLKPLAPIQITAIDDAKTAASVRKAVDGQAPAAPVRKVSDDQAMEIALEQVKGKVKRVLMEQKLGAQRVIAVVVTPDQKEFEVIMDMETGEVLATEEQ